MRALAASRSKNFIFNQRVQFSILSFTFLNNLFFTFVANCDGKSPSEFSTSTVFPCVIKATSYSKLSILKSEIHSSCKKRASTSPTPPIFDESLKINQCLYFFAVSFSPTLSRGFKNFKSSRPTRIESLFKISKV